jgi:HemY protein
MLKFLIIIAILFGGALGFQWLSDTSGEVVLTLGDTAYAIGIVPAVIALFAAIFLVMGLIWFIRETVRSPSRMVHGWRRRNYSRGQAAISQGLIAIAAGDLRAAERLAAEASRRAPGEALTQLLRAQTAQLKGDRAAARDVFQQMTADPATRIAGLRGLYVEAERESEHIAAHQIAARARQEAPSAPWAARALLRHQTAGADWDGALKTLAGAIDGRILDRRTARRQRAVILTAKAIDKEESEPDAARQAALEAHDLAPDLVPAAVVAGRLLSRHNDIRRATRVLEATWKIEPHPELADAYLHVRSGDSAGDRLKRAEALFRMRSHSDEARLAVARAAIDAREFARAREVLAPVLTQRPTRRALMLMAELEEQETGNTGKARGWLARAVHAPRDPAWTADGMVLREWAPVSPTTGKLDAVEWKVPVMEREPSMLEIDTAEVEPPALPQTAARPPVPSEAVSPVLAGITAPEFADLVADDDMVETRMASSEAMAGGPVQAVRSGEPRFGSTHYEGEGGGVAPEAAHDRDERRGPDGDAVEGISAKPPIPDDPGVIDEDEGAEPSRRFGVL